MTATPTLSVAATSVVPTETGRWPMRRREHLGERGRTALVGVRQDCQQPVAAGSPDRIGRSDTEPDAQGDLSKHGITAGDAVHAVDLAEVIDVEENDGHRMLVAAGLGDLDPQPIEDRAAAGDAGERIDRGRALDLGALQLDRAARLDAAPRSFDAARDRGDPHRW